MKSRLTALTVAAALGIGAVLAHQPAFAQSVYGWQLMTPQELAAHRTAMRNLPPAERTAYRARHHEQMTQRAEARGLVLPEQPLVAGAGRRAGVPGYGPGYGFRRPGGRWGQ